MPEQTKRHWYHPYGTQRIGPEVKNGHKVQLRDYAHSADYAGKGFIQLWRAYPTGTQATTAGQTLQGMHELG